jgi:hypothetical protein
MERNKTVMVWLGLLSAQLAFCGVAFLLFPPSGQLADLIATEKGGLVLPLYVAGIFAVIAGYSLPKLMAQKTPANPFSLFVIKVALFESATLFGFILSSLSRNSMAGLPLMVLGVLNTLLAFPQKS